MARWRPPVEHGTALVTPEGHARLKAELDELWRVRRPEVVKALAAAAAEGDRSENAEYTYRKKQLGEIDRRVRYLSKRLQVLRVVDTVASDREAVFFGASVEVEDIADGTLARYRIVGPDETGSASTRHLHGRCSGSASMMNSRPNFRAESDATRSSRLTMGRRMRSPGKRSVVRNGMDAVCGLTSRDAFLFVIAAQAGQARRTATGRPRRDERSEQSMDVDVPADLRRWSPRPRRDDGFRIRDNLTSLDLSPARRRTAPRRRRNVAPSRPFPRSACGTAPIPFPPAPPDPANGCSRPWSRGSARRA